VLAAALVFHARVVTGYGQELLGENLRPQSVRQHWVIIACGQLLASSAQQLATWLTGSEHCCAFCFQKRK
jgi:hypothetical protein